MNNEDTGYTDKSGKPIHVGDTLQLRLGKFGKSGGPSLKRVVRIGKHIKLVDANDTSDNPVGYNLSEQDTKHAVIIERVH